MAFSFEIADASHPVQILPPLKAQEGVTPDAGPCRPSPPEILVSITDSFDLAFEVREHAYIFINGIRIVGEAHCTWKKSEPMFVNGIQTWPYPPRCHDSLPSGTEAELEKRYHDVPSIAGLADSGMAWRRAVHQWKSRGQRPREKFKALTARLGKKLVLWKNRAGPLKEL